MTDTSETEKPGLYSTVAPLNAEKHRDVSLKPEAGFGFARALASTPLGLSEFADIAGDLPIVFAKEGDTLSVVAVMGLGAGRNRMVGADGGWLGRYVPAFLRRYPFILTEPNAENRQALCLDESYPGLNREGRGERLFDSDGSQTAYTKGVLGFAQRVHAEFMRARAFAGKLAELGLLEDVEATIRRADGEPRRVRGFSAVNRERLAGLSDDTLLAMARSGELELVHLHLVSLKAFALFDAAGESAPATATAG
jgi:hypothetical protein